MDRPLGEDESEHAVHEASHPQCSPPHVRETQGSVTGSDTHNYRPAPLNLHTSTPRGMGVSGNYSHYYVHDSSSGCPVETMSSSLLAYGNAYEHDVRNQGPGMGNYGHSMMMYNVSHAGAQHGVYETPHFTPRQQTEMQMMHPDVASAYFSPSTAPNTGTPLGHGPSSPPNVYQFSRQNPGILYSDTMSSINNMQHEEQAQAQAQTQAQEKEEMQSEERQQRINEERGQEERQQRKQDQHHDKQLGEQQGKRDYQEKKRAENEKKPEKKQLEPQRPGPSRSGATETPNMSKEEAAAEIREQLDTIFRDISIGQLEGASALLLRISDWMLSQIKELGKNTGTGSPQIYGRRIVESTQN